MFPAKYVGSFDISDDNGCRLKRLDIVRRRLETVKLCLNRRDFIVACKSVIVVVSASGVRTCSFDQRIIHSCHTLKRISYATCDPDYFLFSFIARQDSAPVALQQNFDDENFRRFGANCFADPEDEEEEERNNHPHHCCSTGRQPEPGFIDHCRYQAQSQQYCHVYRMENREKTEQINDAFSRIFREAYNSNRDNILNCHQKLLLSSATNNYNYGRNNTNQRQQQLKYRRGYSSGSSSNDSLDGHNSHSTPIQSDLCRISDMEICSSDDFKFNPISERNFPALTPICNHSPGVPACTSTTECRYQPQVPPVRMRKKPNVNNANQIPETNSKNLVNSTANAAMTPANQPIKQYQKKRRPVSAVLSSSKRENFSVTKKLSSYKRADSVLILSPPNDTKENNNESSIFNDDSETSLLHNSSSEDKNYPSTNDRLTAETTKTDRKSNRLSATFSGAFFKRIFSNSMWRLSAAAASTTDCDAKPQTSKAATEKSTPSTPPTAAFGGKKRRPLSAVFSNSVKQTRNVCSTKRDSILVTKMEKTDRQRGLFNAKTELTTDWSYQPISENQKAKSSMNLNLKNRQRPDLICHKSVSCLLDDGRITPYDNVQPLNENDEKRLNNAAWFVGRASKEMLYKVLSQECLGSFVVRNSSTHPECLALTVRVPHLHNATGLSHFLILRTEKGYTLKGFSKSFPSVHALVTHHSIMPEQLPCRLVFTQRENSQKFRRQLMPNRQIADGRDQSSSIYGDTTDL